MYLPVSIIQTPQVLDVIYMPKDEYAVFVYLNNYTPRGIGVLAGSIMSNLIHAYAYDRSAIGGLWSCNSVYDYEVRAMGLSYANLYRRIISSRIISPMFSGDQTSNK